MKYFTISKEVADQLLEALRKNWFTSDGNHNNDDIIDAQTVFENELKGQGYDE